MWPSEEVKTAFGLCLMFIQFFIPFIVLILCYGKIVWVLTRRINTDLIKPKSTVDDSNNVSGPNKVCGSCKGQVSTGQKKQN